MQLEDEIFFHQRTLSLKVLHWSWHILLGVSYLLWSYQLPITVAAPLSAILMVTHGSWLMFISLRPQLGQSNPNKITLSLLQPSPASLTKRLPGRHYRMSCVTG